MKLTGNNPTRKVVTTLAVVLISIAAPAVSGGKIVPEGQTSKVTYNWLKTAKPVSAETGQLSAKERKRLAARIAKHGNGSYICSPSGFGKKSHCYMR